MSRRERLILMVIGPLGILLVFYYLIYSPKQAEYTALRAELDERRMQLERMEATARQLTRLREEYTRLQAFIAEVEAKLPAEKEEPSLLVQLERLTRSLGVSLESIRPSQIQAAQAAPPPGAGTPPPPGAVPPPGGGPAAPGGGAPSAGGPPPQPAAPAYLRFPISLQVIATYEQVVKLATELNAFPRMVAIRNLAFSPKLVPVLIVNVDIETYVLPRGAR
jgi:Tfp pilus assembly protein PilO